MLLFVLERLVHLFGETARVDPPTDEVIALCGHEDEEVRTWALRILADRAWCRFAEHDSTTAVEDLSMGVLLERQATNRDPDTEFRATERRSQRIELVKLELGDRDFAFERARAVYTERLFGASRVLA